MYSIHTTRGFIIDARPTGEAGKMLSIFTRELGLVSAIAQGIRLEKSKLRYHAQEHSFGIFSFVRGKEFWRLTSAQDVSEAQGAPKVREHYEVQIPRGVVGSGSGSELMPRVALLLRRLLQGEEPHPELFDRLEASVRFIASAPGISAADLNALETVTVLRILYALGYVASDAKLERYLTLADISHELLRAAAAERLAINQHINKALRESQL